jgi:regulation of enolase protein 1 (concanavalin A-like superfamily)
MDWYNEPPNWSVQDHTILIHSAPQTDFWRLTHSGMIRDSGHFYYQRQVGDFLAKVKVSGQYATLYDQAGMMVRVDEAHWIKCGIEFVDGVQQASAVVTRDYSDWSVVPLPQNPASLWLQVQRHGSTIEIRYSLDGGHYQLLRQAYLAPVESMDVGLMCASPQGTGFSVIFEDWSIQSI